MRMFWLTATVALMAPVGIHGQRARLIQEFTYRDIRELVVEARYFDVEISGGEGNQMHAEVYSPYTDEEVEHSQREGVVRITVPNRVRLLRTTGGSRIVVTVPEEMSLDLSSASGDIRVTRIRGDAIRLSSASGDVEAEDLAGEIEVNTSSGDMRLRAIRGSQRLESSSGEIVVRDAEGDIQAVSSSGDQAYQGIVGDLASRSSSGDISLDGATGALALTSSSGEQSGRKVTLTGDSVFETSSGAIRMQLENSFADLRFDLRSSSGRLEAGSSSSRGGGRLEVGGGSILVRGRSSSGEQSYE